jgi:hypothetical protein
MLTNIFCQENVPLRMYSPSFRWLIYEVSNKCLHLKMQENEKANAGVRN